MSKPLSRSVSKHKTASTIDILRKSKHIIKDRTSIESDEEVQGRLALSVHQLKGAEAFPTPIETMWITDDSFVDSLNEHFYLYWYDKSEENLPLRISRLDLKTYEWTHLTNFLPIHDGTVSRLCRINGENVLLIFFDRRDENSKSPAKLFMVNVNDRAKWSLQIDVPIIPRVDATIEFVNNRLFIFGGRGKKATRSFSEGIFDPFTGQWKWLVPGPQNSYPPHVPSLGICLGSQLIFGNSKILLAAGEDKKSRVKLQGRIFIYSIEENTFTPFTATGFLPSTIKCYDMSLYFHDRFFGDEDAEKSKDEQRCCVLISGWDNVTRMPRIPQLLALNISSSPGKSEVVHINAYDEVNDLLRENNLDMISVNAVTGKRVVALCSESEGQTVTWDKLIEIAV